MAFPAMTERVDEIRTPVQRGAARGVRQKRARREEQPLPDPDQESPAEGKAQVMRLERAGAGRPASQVGPQVFQIRVRDVRERRIGKGREIVGAIGTQAVAHGLDEVPFAPVPDAGILIGGDVRAVKSPEGGFQRTTAGKGHCALLLFGVAADAAAGLGEVLPPLPVPFPKPSLKGREEDERKKQKPRSSGAFANDRQTTASRGKSRGNRRTPCRSRRVAPSPLPRRRSC